MPYTSSKTLPKLMVATITITFGLVAMALSLATKIKRPLFDGFFKKINAQTRYI